MGITKIHLIPDVQAGRLFCHRMVSMPDSVRLLGGYSIGKSFGIGTYRDDLWHRNKTLAELTLAVCGFSIADDSVALGLGARVLLGYNPVVCNVSLSTDPIMVSAARESQRYGFV